jgi:hypothetical protein
VGEGLLQEAEEEEEVRRRREELHRRLGMARDRPAFRLGQALSFPGEAQPKSGGPLSDVHLGLGPSGVPGSTVHLVEGSYDYFHYMQVLSLLASWKPQRAWERGEREVGRERGKREREGEKEGEGRGGTERGRGKGGREAGGGLCLQSHRIVHDFGGTLRQQGPALQQRRAFISIL